MEVAISNCGTHLRGAPRGDIPGDRARTIADARFGKLPKSMPDGWRKLPNTKWESYNLSCVWKDETDQHQFKNPGMYYSSTFGYVIAEKLSYREYAFPFGTFWEDVNQFEQSCLCVRGIGYIVPGLTYKSLNKSVIYTRPTGHYFRLHWNWTMTDAEVRQWNPGNQFIEAMTKYKLTLLKLFDLYSSVQASCSLQYEKNRTRAELYNIFYETKNNFAHCKRKNQIYECIKCSMVRMMYAYEPVKSDLIIQEVDHTKTLGYWELDFIPPSDLRLGRWWRRGEERRPTANLWPSAINGLWCAELPSRIKWLLPLYAYDDTPDLRDGPPEKLSGNLPLYYKFPSMSKIDQACQSRVRANTKLCRDPVGGLEIKLAHFDHIHYDISNGELRFPGPPLIIKGHGRSEMRGIDSSKPRKSRKKRFLFTILAMAFSALLSLVTSSTLQSEFNSKVEDLTTQLNTRFTLVESNLKEIADKVSQLSAITVSQGQKLNQVILNMLEHERVRDAQLEAVIAKVNENKNMIMAQADSYFSAIQTVQSMTIAEVAINELIISKLQNSTGKPIFDATKTYLIRIKNGLINLKEYSQKISAYESDYRNSSDHQGQKLKMARQKLKETRTEVEYRINVFQQGINRTIVLNATEFNHDNVTFIRLNGLVGKDIFQNIDNSIETVAEGASNIIKEIAHGTGSLIKTGVNGIGDVIEDGIGSIFGGLGKFLIPIGIALGALMIVFCLIKFFPGCKTHKQAIEERNNHTEMAAFVTTLKPHRTIVRKEMR